MMTSEKTKEDIQLSACISVEDEICSSSANGEPNDHSLEAGSQEGTLNNKTEIKPQQDNQNKILSDETQRDDSLPVDKGWAWVVLVGATFCFILFGGIKKNFGIFFVAIQDRFTSSASVTSSLVTIQRLCKSFIALITLTVGMKLMSNRMAVIIGAFLLTASHIISALAVDIRMLFVSIGILEGIAKALLNPFVTVALLEYFDKRRGLANGLATSGASFGGLIFGPIFAELFNSYGYTGTLMIVAGLTLNFMVTGALLRPIESFKRKPLTSTETMGDTEDVKSIQTDNIKRQEISIEKAQITKSNVQTSLSDRLKVVFDIYLFKTLVFPVFLLTAAMLATTTDLLLTFLVPLAHDFGLNSNQNGILMAVVGGVGMFSRLITGLFADRKWMKLTTLLAVLSMIAGIVAHCARFFKSFSLLVVMAVLLGFTCEMYLSIYPLVLVECITLSKTKSGMGFTILCQGVAVASTYPIVGWLRDFTGNYYASYHFMGTMSFIGAFSAMSLPYVRRGSKRK